MNQLRTLYRNSRKNSLYGMKAKRTLHIIMFAVSVFTTFTGLLNITDKRNRDISFIPNCRYMVPSAIIRLIQVKTYP